MYNDTTEVVPDYACVVSERRPRRQLHGYVSVEARDGWYRFAEANSTNVTALLEAMGLKLAAVTESGSLPSLLREVARDAQRVAGTRSSRRRTQ